ncbi:MAG: gamma-glutamyltransferase [Deltaproteobacteria bacterium]|nr:gamma-glutamyltransferase [Deltaproteobacteria bacterium]
MAEAKTIVLSEEGFLAAPQAMICSDNPHISRVGAQVLCAGANAVDAVVAAAFTAGVVHAHCFSLAGAGGLLLVWLEKESRAYAVDFPPVAPLAAKQGTFKLLPSGEPNDCSHLIGARAVTVPAVMAGLARALEQFGTLSLKKAVGPAMELASGGFRVHATLSRATHQPHIARFPATAHCFLKKNRPLRPGAKLTQADQGILLQKLTEEGPDAFYRGDVARDIVEHLRSLGGLMTLEDLARYRVRVYPAFRGDYRDALIFGGPASTSGSPLLFLTLNILEGLNMRPLPSRSVESVHWMVEAMKLAWAEHRRTMGYVGKNIHPFELMVAKSLAAKLRAMIDPHRAVVQSPSYRTPLALHPDASAHIAAVDADGNMAVFSQTQGAGLFGSGVTIPKWGLVMNNGMVFFDHRRGRPHSLEPGKRARVLTGSILVLRKRQPFLVIGATGGISAIAPLVHLLVDIIEHGQSLTQALGSPRIFYKESGCVMAEQTLPPMVRKGLQKMGHALKLVQQDQELPGPILGIQVDHKGESRTGSVDLRRDGGALAGF